MKTKFLRRCMLFLLVACFTIPFQSMAANMDEITPHASHYLSSYSAYCYGAGGGKVQVWYDVTGTRDMDDIGALSIELYESRDGSNWTWVESFTNRQIPGMLGHNVGFYASHIDYQGISGRFYKAKVCVWAGRNGGGDRRYFWTATERAN